MIFLAKIELILLISMFLISKETPCRNAWEIKACGKSKTDGCSCTIDTGLNGARCVVLTECVDI